MYNDRKYSYGKIWTDFKDNSRGTAYLYVYWDNPKISRKQQAYNKRKKRVIKARTEYRKKSKKKSFKRGYKKWNPQHH